MVATLTLTLGYSTIVDDEDVERIGAWKWCVSCSTRSSPKPYAVRGMRIDGRFRKLRLHREIVGALPGQHVDHINGDTLDNRRCNLRIATRSQNNANSRQRPSISGFRGVYQSCARTRWMACISKDGKRTHLGQFPDKISAARAYDAAARAAFGEFARLNFPEAAE